MRTYRIRPRAMIWAHYLPDGVIPKYEHLFRAWSPNHRLGVGTRFSGQRIMLVLRNDKAETRLEATFDWRHWYEYNTINARIGVGIMWSELRLDSLTDRAGPLKGIGFATDG